MPKNTFTVFGSKIVEDIFSLPQIPVIFVSKIQEIQYFGPTLLKRISLVQNCPKFLFGPKNKAKSFLTPGGGGGGSTKTKCAAPKSTESIYLCSKSTKKASFIQSGAQPFFVTAKSRKIIRFSKLITTKFRVAHQIYTVSTVSWTTHGHTNAHTHDAAQRWARTLLRSCRAALDVFRSVVQKKTVRDAARRQSLGSAEQEQLACCKI